MKKYDIICNYLFCFLNTIIILASDYKTNDTIYFLILMIIWSIESKNNNDKFLKNKRYNI